MPDTTDLTRLLSSETLLSGPQYTYNRSFKAEYFRPSPTRDASVLMRGTYVMSHPETKLGKKYAQVPPLHLHFEQAETFVVLQGKIGTTMGYEGVDTIWHRGNTKSPITIKPWTPHTFWPVVPNEAADGDETEDAVLLIWAHPTKSSGDFAYPPSMDHLFFSSLLGHMGNVHEGKEKLDILWLMLLQQESQSVGVMLPKWYFLGPLRWFIPYMMQASLAAIARWQGKTPLSEKYIGSKDFEGWQAATQKTKAS